jgi:lipopolysaccharide/colanic/teichoic acid biosynthesis glycosyltransferase
MGLSENLESMQLPLVVRKLAPKGCAWLARYATPKRRLNGLAYRRAKRIMDLALVFLASPIWLPWMGIIAIETAIGNPGQPVLQTELRAGRGGRRFRMYRFNGKAKDNPLPHLLNVLKGEMSLVGPRATSFQSDGCRLWHTTRLDVPPGVTGLWRIVNYEQSGEDEQLRLDIAYIDRRCILLDFEILLRTGIVLLQKPDRTQPVL